MRECWAACLGDCSEKLSGEHLITSGVFLADEVRVKGLPWCPDFKTIGLSSLVRNVLCQSHNSRLSDKADNGAIQLRKAICDANSFAEGRRLAASGKNWPIETFSVDGLAIERWCLKTLITMALGGPSPIGATALPGNPSRELVEIAFGLRKFNPPRAGLHFPWSPGGTVGGMEGVEVTIFSDNTKTVAGARFWFWGLALLLVLNDGPEGPFIFTSQDGKMTVYPRTTYHPLRIHLSVDNRPSHVLEFVWTARSTSTP